MEDPEANGECRQDASVAPALADPGAPVMAGPEAPVLAGPEANEERRR